MKTSYYTIRPLVCPVRYEIISLQTTAAFERFERDQNVKRVKIIQFLIAITKQKNLDDDYPTSRIVPSYKIKLRRL